MQQVTISALLIIWYLFFVNFLFFLGCRRWQRDQLLLVTTPQQPAINKLIHHYKNFFRFFVTFFLKESNGRAEAECVQLKCSESETEAECMKWNAVHDEGVQMRSIHAGGAGTKMSRVQGSLIIIGARAK